MKNTFSRREALRWMALSSAALLASCRKTGQLTPADAHEGVAASTATPGTEPTQTATIPQRPTPTDTPQATASATPQPTVDLHGKDVPLVWMTQNINPEELLGIYQALGREARGKVAVKIASGEPGGHFYLSPELIAPLVKEVDGTIVECNTAYFGGRSNTKSHLKAMEDHGFSAIAPVDVMDAEGEISLPITGGIKLEEIVVGSHFANYDFVINLAHFKGHAMAGFGGVLKNMAIGIASTKGKSLIHSAGTQISGYSPSTPVDDFLESMAEGAKGIADSLAGNIIYINVMNNLSVDCDCDSHPTEPTMKDIGILASLDPVALDQACVDLVYTAPDGQDLIARLESRHGIHVLEHAGAIGLGSRTYELVNMQM